MLKTSVKRITRAPGYIDFVFNFSSVLFLMTGVIYGSCEAVMLTRAQIDYISVKS